MLSTQVLIIGAGPVGMVAALSLAQSGIRCVLVDKRLERLDAPKAHAVNARTLEICERLGVSADDVRAAGASIDDGGEVHFVDVLNGTCFGSLPYERQDDGAKEFTPWPLVNIPQPKFEEFLSARLTHCAGVSLLRGVTAREVSEESDGVVASLEADGSAAPLAIRADYVIAADGAGSPTREQLGIGMTGPEALQHHMMIHFDADLRALTSAHPGLLYFCLSPEAGGAFIGYERDRTWVFMQSYDPVTQSRDDFDEPACRQLIEAAAGAPIEDFKLKNVSPWTMSAQVADAYRKGRVFLAGDAAHRFPPTGGLGLNTGVADAENIAWKLAKVLQGQAQPSLLDTYESERRAIAQINTQQSLMNSAKIMHVFAAVYGPDPKKTAEHYAAMCANPDDPGIREAVEIQRPHFDSFNLQLGYRYGACVDPETIDISRYVPSFEVGDYLPLVKLTDSPWLLGLLPHDDFALVTGPDAAEWANDQVAVFSEDADFDPTQPFHTRAGLSTSGALLIRPDGHICARWIAAPEDPQAALGECLTNALAGNTVQQTQEH